ncbi:MAG TPA: energy-dependent translational throttle protein EttA [Gemmatimonadales bacterium]|jgi:ATP-binding cassette ChvD family protein|nr:energy-dependent translational throttle protein EttA [Gemmatimonadales bacterium]
MAGEYIFTMRDLRKVVPPSREILKGIHLSFFPGAKIGVLGANGAGKSSLLRIMAGVDKDFLGDARPLPGTRIGFLPQEPQLDPSKDVRGNVMDGVRAQQALLDQFNEISAKFAEPMDDDEMTRLLEKQGNLQERIDALGLWELDHKIDLAMDALRLPPGEAEVSKISGGERRRVALCRLLLEEPDMLLLDEPTNHLDAESVWWLERYLAEFKGTVVAVTHDRYFLDNVAGWILELYQGAGIPWEGNYSSWLEQKERRLGQEEKQASARRKTLQHELEWVRMSPRARQAKSKARITRYEELREEAERQTEGSAEILIPVPERLGDEVVIANDVSKGFGDRLLFENLSFSLPRGGIVGVIGPNGAGKTTLFRMITGQESPDSGKLTVGSTVQVAYVDQSRDALDPDNTVYQEISGGQDQLQFGRRTVNARAYAAGFNFRGADQQKKVGTLSGGERNRLHLAKLLKSGGNLLLLDEPTNDLDVDTLRALEEALVGFAGCAVVISHDRWFLDRIATHILAFEGNSEVVWFEGNYGEYAADLKRRKGVDANQPHRIRYKKLVH